MLRFRLRLVNLWKFLAFIGATLVITGIGIKLFSFIPWIASDIRWSARFWGDVLTIVFGPIFLGKSLAFYIGINEGPLPGTKEVIENIIKIKPAHSKLSWLKLLTIGILIAGILGLTISRRIYIPGISIAMMSACRGEWLNSFYRLPMIIIGMIGIAYAVDLYTSLFYRIINELESKKTN